MSSPLLALKKSATASNLSVVYLQMRDHHTFLLLMERAVSPTSLETIVARANNLFFF
jgi:hypothetical protein